MNTIAQSLELPQFTQAEADRVLSDESLCKRMDALGIDIGLIVSNLQCSPEMRMKRHANALRMALAFKKVGEEARNK